MRKKSLKIDEKLKVYVVTFKTSAIVKHVEISEGFHFHP